MTCPSARPSDGPLANIVSHRLVTRHYRATATGDVIGSYSLAPEPNCVGRAATAEIDAHNPHDDPERNRRYAEHLYFNLAADGFRPLLATWGAGSFHLHTMFDRDVPGAELYAFGRWLVSDAAGFGFDAPVESFPKQAVVAKEKYGNWCRLIGRHHTRDVWASVFNGTEWLEGAAAVAHVLSLTGDSPELIPAGARPRPVSVPPAILPLAPLPTPALPVRAGGSGEDVFEEYNRAATLDHVVGQLEARGHKVIRRESDRVEFLRAGKSESGSESFNVKLINGVPIVFCFSTAAGLPSQRGLNPAQVRCHLEHGTIDKDAMAKLAVALKAEFGWSRPAKPAPARPLAPAVRNEVPPPRLYAPDGIAPEEPRTGVAIILEYFREVYRPVFKDGTAIQAGDGATVPMGEATAVCDSRLIERLEHALDVPRYAGRDGRAGDVKRTSLPGFFRTWSRVAWGDLLRALPDEETADIGPETATADGFRRKLRDALLTQLTLADRDERGGDQAEKRSLVDWCVKFSKAGPWRSLRSYKIWFRSRLAGGEVVLQLAIRPELFGQLKLMDKYLCGRTCNWLSTLCGKYGIGRSDRSERPSGQSAVVLEEAFVADLIQFTPDEGAEGLFEAA